MGGGLSPALPVLIQIPVFLSLSCVVKSLLYNFNFLQGLIPWSVVAQAFNPCTQPLSRRTVATPDPAGLREEPFCSQFLLYIPMSILHCHLKCCSRPPDKPALGVWVSGTTQGEASGREHSLVGESRFCDSHSPPQPTHRYFPHLVGWCSESQSNLFHKWVLFKKKGMYEPTYVKDSPKAQKFWHDPVPSLGLLLGEKDAADP